MACERGDAGRGCTHGCTRFWPDVANYGTTVHYWHNGHDATGPYATPWYCTAWHALALSDANTVGPTVLRTAKWLAAGRRGLRRSGAGILRGSSCRISLNRTNTRHSCPSCGFPETGERGRLCNQRSRVQHTGCVQRPSLHLAAPLHTVVLISAWLLSSYTTRSIPSPVRTCVRR